MPFKRTHAWEFPWEQAAERGEEFIASITTHDARAHWFLVAEKVRHSGVLVVLHYDKPIGVEGAPLIFLEILRQRRAGKPGEWHREIEAGLEKAIRFAELQDESKRTETPTTLSTRTISVNPKPKSVAALFQQFDAVAITYRRRQVRAFLFPLSVLARAWTDPTGADQLLDWMRDTIRATDEPLWTW